MPHEECRVVRECQTVCKPVCTTVQVPVCRKVLPDGDADLHAAPSAGWCRSSASATRPGPAATRCREENVLQMPYTTCRMVPRAARPVRDADRCYTVPEQHVRYCTYTTCRMVPEQHVRDGDAQRGATPCRK